MTESHFDVMENTFDRAGHEPIDEVDPLNNNGAIYWGDYLKVHEQSFPAIVTGTFIEDVYTAGYGSSDASLSITVGRNSVLIDAEGGESYVQPSKREIQARLRERWAEVRARAVDHENEVDEPVQGIVNLLGGLPGDYATWREILEEPYG